MIAAFEVHGDASTNYNYAGLCAAESISSLGHVYSGKLMECLREILVISKQHILGCICFNCSKSCD